MGKERLGLEREANEVARNVVQSCKGCRNGEGAGGGLRVGGENTNDPPPTPPPPPPVNTPVINGTQEVARAMCHSR